jgi:hypothetical protein
MSINEIAQEVWCFYPEAGDDEPTRYAIFSYSSTPYWAVGALTRTAFHNPVWQSKPIGANNFAVYNHESGWLNDGVTRLGEVFAETGGMESGEGDRVTWIDRLWQDIGGFDSNLGPPSPSALEFTFKLRQSPSAPERIVGPIVLNEAKGYTTLRMRARQFVVRIDQVEDDYWQLGKVRLRTKVGGAR